MKFCIFSVIAAALLAVAGQSAGATASMQSSMMMPKCAASDTVVGMNTMNKKYMTHGQMMMKMSGMSESKTRMMMQKNHIKLMCMSKAKAMGATMMGSNM